MIVCYEACPTPVRIFDGGTENVIVFFPDAGATHFLSFLAWAVYSAVKRRGPCVVDDALVQAIVRDIDVEPEDLAIEDVRHVVAELDGMGLLRPAAARGAQ